MHKNSANEKYAGGSRKVSANMPEHHIYCIVQKGLT